jgi:hypothetical protein
MEKKMVHKLLIPVVHATPVDHNDMLLLKIVNGKDFPRVANQVKEAILKETLVYLILF